GSDPDTTRPREPPRRTRDTRQTPQSPPRPNDEVQQRGRLQRLHALKSRNAGPICCNGWFGVPSLAGLAAPSRPPPPNRTPGRKATPEGIRSPEPAARRPPQARSGQKTCSLTLCYSDPVPFSSFSYPQRLAAPAPGTRPPDRTPTTGSLPSGPAYPA